MQEIRDIQEMNARYWELSVKSQTERAAFEARSLRLLQIKEALAGMMNTLRKLHYVGSLARNSEYVTPDLKARVAV